MIPATHAEARAIAKQAELEADTAEERARYAHELADALTLERLVLVRHEWNPPTWTVTYKGAILGEVTNDRHDAVIGGWTAHPTNGDATGPHHTARAAASSLIADTPRIHRRQAATP